MRRQTALLKKLAAFHFGELRLIEDGRPRMVDATEVSVDCLDVLPVLPLLGRTFREEERSSWGPAHVVATHGF